MIKLPSKQVTVLIRYLLVAVLVRLADEGVRVALVLLALERTVQAGFGGALVAAILVPHVVAAPIVGAVADGVGRRRRFHVACLLLFGAALAVTALLTGRAGAPIVLVILTLGGCCAPLLTGGLTSLIRDLAAAGPRDRWYGLDAATYNIAGAAGPAASALLDAAFGAAAAVLVLAASTATGALLLGTLPLPDRASRRPTRSHAGRGVAILWRDRTLLAVTLASSVGQVGIGGLPLVVALLATQRHATPAASGAFLSAFGIGGLLGSICYARYPYRGHPAHMALAAMLGIAVPLAMVPLVSTLISSLLLFGLAGFLNGPLLSSLMATREQRAPADLHTQVFTLGAGAKMSAAALGSGLAGLTASASVDALLLAVAGCQLLGAAAGALVLRGRW